MTLTHTFRSWLSTAVAVLVSFPGCAASVVQPETKNISRYVIAAADVFKIGCQHGTPPYRRAPPSPGAKNCFHGELIYPFTIPKLAPDMLGARFRHPIGNAQGTQASCQRIKPSSSCCWTESNFEYSQDDDY
jgi:hypothetical protein